MARILVIEDEELVRLTITHMLEGAGHEVSIAADGEEGLRQFRQNTPDLVICDVFMPRKSGIAVLKALREANADVPVIVMSGGSPSPMRGETAPVDHLELAQLLGAAGTISKPFRASELIGMVQRYL
jgi:CheY-like chemotaxis protein